MIIEYRKISALEHAQTTFEVVASIIEPVLDLQCVKPKRAHGSLVLSGQN